MAEYGYVKICDAKPDGTAGAQIEGSSSDEGYPKWSFLYRLDAECFFDFDNIKGEMTSKQHSKPVHVSLRLDEGAAEFLKRLRKSLALNVVIALTTKNKSGNVQTYFALELRNARCVSWRVWVPDTQDRSTQECSHRLDLAFSYESLVVLNEKYDSTVKAHPKKEDAFDFRNPTK